MRISTFYALVAGMLVVSLGVGSIVPLLPVYAQTMGATGIWVGLIFGGNPLIRAVFDIIFGRMGDARGMKRFLVVGLAGYALVALGFMLAQTPFQLFLWRAMQGVFGSMVFPISQAYAGKLTPAGKEGIVMSYFNLSFFGGLALGPIMGGFLNDRFGLSAPFLAMAVLSLLALVLVSLFVPERRDASKEGHAFSLSLLLRDGVVQSVVCARLFLSMGRGLFTTLMPVWGATYLGLPAVTVGAVVSLRFTVETVMQPVFGMTADRINRERMVLVGFVFAPIALYLMPMTRGMWELLAVSVLLALNGSVCVPAITSISTAKGREIGMGSIMGITGTAMDLGMASGAFLGGTVMDLAGIGASFRTAAFLSALGMMGYGYLAWGRSRRMSPH